MKSVDLLLEGGCFCGKLRYRFSGTPRFSLACQCTDCQQMSASAFSLGLIVPVADFIIVSEILPRVLEKVVESGAVSSRYQCPSCAVWTQTTASSNSELMVLRPSSLDDPTWFRPIAQLFKRSALSWALLPLPLSFETEFKSFTDLEMIFAASDIRPSSIDLQHPVNDRGW